MDLITLTLAKNYTDSVAISGGGTSVTTSTTNGNIKINGAESIVYTHPSGTNPHSTTKSDVGLSNVDNTSDIDKPVSTNQATAISLKVDKVAGSSLISDETLANLNSHKSSTSNPHSTSLLQLSDINIVNPTDGQKIAYDVSTSKWINTNTTVGTDEKVKATSTSMASKYLDELIDNDTITMVGDKLIVNSVNGVTKAELLTLVGMDSNIRATLSTLASAGMTFKGVKNTKAEINAIIGMLTGELYIVKVDESQSNLKTSYIYDGTSWISLGESNVSVRDFTVDKIDLTSEVKNVLPKANMDLTGIATSTDLANYTTTANLSTNYALKSDLTGKANSSDVYTKTESDTNFVAKVVDKSLTLDTEIAKIHEHTNKTILDGVTSTKITEWNSKANPVHVHSISDVTNLQTSLDNKVDDSQVLTNVPVGAVFTDTVYTHPTSHSPSIITQDPNNRFMTDVEKAKVGKIITDGLGTKYLNDLGNYVVVESGGGSGSSIDDLAISPTTTYSSTKITSITGDINDVALPTDLQGKSLVDMVKVNFTNANEAKNYIVNAIGDSSLASNTFLEISNSLLSNKQAIVDALATKSIASSQSDSLETYATKINSITQNSTIKNTKLNKLATETSTIVLTNPTTIQNISTSVLEYQEGETGVVKYVCNFNNGDETSFTTNETQHLIFDGKMKQDNNIFVTNMTSGDIIGGYSSYSATIDKTQFYKISSISEVTDTNEVLTINGTYPPTLVQANSDIDLTGVDRISDIIWTATTTNASKLLLIYSIDSGVSWKGYDSVNHLALDITSISDFNEIKTKGISNTDLNVFTQTDLDNIRNGSPKIRFAYYIEKDDVNDTLENDSITLNVDRTGIDTFSTHYTVSFDGVQTLTYTFSADSTYTIIYTDNN